MSEGPMNTILVVDDDPDVIKPLARILRAVFSGRDWKVVTAGSIKEAVAQAKDHNVTHLVHDMGFVGEGNGTTLHEALGPILRERGLVVCAVAMTGGTDAADFAYMAARKVQVFAKPFNTEALLDAIRNGEPNMP